MQHLAQTILNDFDSLDYFNRAVRDWKQDPVEAWEDATNMELGEYHGSLTAARRAICPLLHPWPGDPSIIDIYGTRAQVDAVAQRLGGYVDLEA